MKILILGLLTATVLTAPAISAAPSDPRVISGSFGGGQWQARSTIIGQTSTATIAGGGDPLYLPSRPQKNGVVQLAMDYGGGNVFTCSGSLASDRRSIVTAAHCVTIDGKQPKKTTAYFFDGDPDQIVAGNPMATAVDVSKYFVQGDYSFAVVDQNDIAVLRLKKEAPAWATAYDLYTDDIAGKEFNVAGYGGRSDTGGAVGINLGTGRLREGDNVYDFRLGDDRFGGELAAIFEVYGGQVQYSYLSDFDNGLAVNDGACLVAAALNLGAGTLCDTGLGAREVSIAGGDSGGPGFIDGRLASVNSYSLSFGNDFGDYDLRLNSSWGEFAGYVPVYLHADFVNASLFQGGVPEPATWGMMIAGFGLVGAAARRRRQAIAVC
jgi:hypothetical protein